MCVRCNEVVWQGGELTVEQLQEQKRFLEEDRDHEREERNYFQLERIRPVRREPRAAYRP